MLGFLFVLRCIASTERFFSSCSLHTIQLTRKLQKFFEFLLLYKKFIPKKPKQTKKPLQKSQNETQMKTILYINHFILYAANI